MKRTLIFLGLGAVAAVALANVKSGLAVGENISAFHPTHVSGPLANSTNCFPCTFKARPQVQVWVNGDDMENVAGIAKTLNSRMGKNDDFKALVVLISKDAGAAKATLAKAAKMPGMDKVGMAYLAPDHEAVKSYKINLEAKNTVFVYRNWQVTEKYVDLKANEANIKNLNAAIDKAVAMK